MKWQSKPPTESGYYWWIPYPDMEPVPTYIDEYGFVDGNTASPVAKLEGSWFSERIEPPHE